MKRPAPLIRLPQSLLLLSLFFSFGAAVISGGVAYSQGSGGAGWAGVDLTVFKGCCAALILLVLVWRFAPIGWIKDAEISGMEAEEFKAEMQAGTSLNSVLHKIKFWLYLSALVSICSLIFPIFGIDLMSSKWLDLSARLPNGDTGATFRGFTLGYFRLIGRNWTGVELTIIGLLLILLRATVWKGFAHIVKANRPKSLPPR
jgi:hypothetical protein